MSVLAALPARAYILVPLSGPVVRCLLRVAQGLASYCHRTKVHNRQKVKRKRLCGHAR